MPKRRQKQKQKRKKKQKIVKLDTIELKGILQRAEAELNKEDYELLKDLAQSYQLLLRLVRQRGTTIARLRRLAGFASSERTADVLEGQGTEGDRGAGGGGADGEAADEAYLSLYPRSPHRHTASLGPSS